MNTTFFPLFQHRDTKDNNPDIKFEFTPENLKVSLIYFFINTEAIQLMKYSIYRESTHYCPFTLKGIKEQL